MFSKDGIFYCSDACSRQPDRTDECVCGHRECETASAVIEPTET